MFTENQKNAISQIASKLNIPAQWLENLIWYESKGDPIAENAIGARGLIQFVDSTAQDMGYNDADHIVSLYPDFVSQLEKPVFDYLKRYAPYRTNVEFYNAVFLPAYRKKEWNFSFPEKYHKNNMVQITSEARNKLGVSHVAIATPMHYTAFVLGKFSPFVMGNVTASELYEPNPYIENAPPFRENMTANNTLFKSVPPLQKKNNCGGCLDNCPCRGVLLQLKQLLNEIDL